MTVLYKLLKAITFIEENQRINYRIGLVLLYSWLGKKSSS